MSCTPFAYNTGSTLSGTSQICDLAIGGPTVECGSNYGGLKWWAGPDDTLGYIIANARPAGQPVPGCVTEPQAYVGFWRSKLLTEQSFLDLANYIAGKNNQPPFTNANDAVIWLNANCYYTNFVPTTPTPTITNTMTQTPTQTVTPSGLGGFFFTTKYTIETSVPNNIITLPSSIQNCDFGQTYSFGFMSVAATSSKYLPSSTVTNNGVTNTVTNNFVSGSSPYNFSSYQLGYFEGSGTTTRIQYVVKKNGVQVNTGNFLVGGRPVNQACNSETGLTGITSLASNDEIEIIWSLYVAPTPTQTRTQTPTRTPTQTVTPTQSITQSATPTFTTTPTQTPTLTQTLTSTVICNDCRNWEYQSGNIPVQGDVIYYRSCVDGSLQTRALSFGDPTGTFCNCNSILNPPYTDNGTILTEIGICPTPTPTPTYTPTPTFNNT